MNICCTNNLFPPPPLSLAIPEISTEVRTDFSAVFGLSIEKRVTMPIPPTQEVAIRQNSNPRGSDYMSLSIDAPVVVKPETVSKKELAKENSPPYIRKGSIPKRLPQSQAPTTTK